MPGPSRVSGPVSDADLGAAESHRLPPVEAKIAPDDLRVVDQEADLDEERATVAEAAAHQRAVAREQRARQPSTRFWESRHAQIGPILALLAGVFTLAVRTWPIAVPRERGPYGLAWLIGDTVAGALYIVGFVLADRHWRRARGVLIRGAILQLVVGVLAAALVSSELNGPGPLSALYDVVPAVVALIAAFLISEPDRAPRR